MLFSQWIVSNSGTSTALRSVHFPNAVTGYCAGENGLILKTSNRGQSWETLASGTSSTLNSVFFLNTSTGIACGSAGVIVRTTNGGINWSTVASGVTDDLRSLSFFSDRGICSGISGTILYTTNSGSSWTVAKNGFLTTLNGAFIVSASYAYVCGVNTIFQPFIGKSTNGGINWNYSSFYLNFNEGGLTDVSFISETEGFASAYVFNGQGAISYTTNAGDNWTTQLFPNQLYGIDMTGLNYGYVCGDNASILKTTNRGLSWTAQSNPASVLLRSINFVDSANGFVVGENGTILKTTNGGLSSIHHSNVTTPENFVLHQNHPNPFNPSTIFEYELFAPANVVIKIFNNSGKEIETLVNMRQPSGNHKLHFDASKYPSGTFYFVLESQSQQAVRKFVILK